MAETNQDDVSVKKLRRKFEKLIVDKYGDETGNNKRGAHVLVTGGQGHGKSAMINTIVKAITGKYYRLADFGGGHDQTKTLHLLTLEKFGIKPYMLKQTGVQYENEMFTKCLPSISDFTGLADETEGIYQEILELLILGHIKPGTSIEAICRTKRRLGKKMLKSAPEYSIPNRNWRITHIIFVQSCSVIATEKAAVCVKRVLDKTREGRNIPIYNGHVYVVMTMYDEFNRNAFGQDMLAKHNGDEKNDLTRREKTLAKIFNLEGAMEHSFHRWISCCDSVGYDNPKQDIWVLQFLIEMLEHPDPVFVEAVEVEEPRSGCVIH